MKIVIMSCWNIPYRVAAYAEAVGRMWVVMGHVREVFVPMEWDALQTQEDEP